MKKTYPLLIATLLVISLAPTTLQAHCQVPCGIYDDHARVMSMLEDAATVEKAINQINDLAGKTDAQSQNQMVRWVMNKESHAQSVIETISAYFMTQRVKTSQKDYEARLKDHHAVVLAAMKAKQSTSSKDAKALKAAIEVLREYYPEHKH
ncbi:MAG: superoxide dismutase, Ni [Candidatus Marinimicrobia bacterium]|nr:superoxide dismutase, Ni [Candidatus Neomarinimicrobiota bacterium]MCF7903615.1 superoxide dismutase, Ni [Candidatus Neomarinimicrobiota bacterium]